MSWTMRVEGRPVPWSRTRGRGKRRYTPRKYRDFKALLQLQARAAGAPRTGREDVRLAVRVGLANRSGQGDLDNYCKAVMDALEGVIWANDRYIVELEAELVVGEGEWLEVEVVR